MSHGSSQSPSAYDRQNLTAALLRARLSLDSPSGAKSVAYRYQNAAELAASVVPTDYSRLPGDLLRYGFGVASSSAVNAAAFNNACLSNSSVFCDEPGTYVCSDFLNVQSNQTIRLAQGVVLQASVKLWGNPFIYISSKTNVRWYGGVIDGNKAANPTGTLIGLIIRDSTDVKVFGVTSRNCPSDNVSNGAQGDGFYIGGNSDPGSVDVDLIGCHGEDNVRQGLSIVRGERISIIGGSYEGTTGNNPGAGIDLEANNPAYNLRNISITGVNISGCYYGIVFQQASTDVTCTGCTITDCRFAAVYFAGCTRVTMSGCIIRTGTHVASTPVIECVSAVNVVFTGNVVKGKAGGIANEGALFRVLGGCSNLLVANNTFEKSQTQGVLIGSSAMNSAVVLVRVLNNTFLDCVDPTAAANSAPLSISGNSGSGIYASYVSFIGNTVYDTRSGGNEADLAIAVSSSIPLATQAGYRISDNFILGPAAAYTSGALVPLTGALSWNPASLGDGGGETSPAITVTGAALGDLVHVYPPYDLQGIQHSAFVSAANTVQIRIQNETGGVLDLANASWRVQVVKAPPA